MWQHHLRMAPLLRNHRPMHLVLIGGLAAGAGFAAVTGISAAATGSHAKTTKPGAHHALPPGPGLGPMMGGGGEGTITALAADTGGTYTLTLRTLAGNETVTTTSTTTVYGADLQTATLSSADVGLVASVQPVRGSGTSSTSTITAASIRFVDPTVTGKVTNITANTYTLVGPDGQEITVTTTSSTYYLTGHSATGPTTTTTPPTYTVGEMVFASGPETTTGTQSATSPTTSLQAVLMSAAPTWGPRAGGNRGGFGGWGGGPHGRLHGAPAFGGPPAGTAA